MESPQRVISTSGLPCKILLGSDYPLKQQEQQLKFCFLSESSISYGVFDVESTVVIQGICIVLLVVLRTMVVRYKLKAQNYCHQDTAFKSPKPPKVSENGHHLPDSTYLKLMPVIHVLVNVVLFV